MNPFCGNIEIYNQGWIFCMKENKNNEVVKYLLENYDIKNANDIAYALKDMFKDTIQTMMNAEFDSSMGYEKSDNKIENQIIEMAILLKK